MQIASVLSAVLDDPINVPRAIVEFNQAIFVYRFIEVAWMQLITNQNVACLKGFQSAP